MNPSEVVKIHIMLTLKRSFGKRIFSLNAVMTSNFNARQERSIFCMIRTAPSPVHTDLNIMWSEFRHKLRTGELTSLMIRVKCIGSK